MLFLPTRHYYKALYNITWRALAWKGNWCLYKLTVPRRCEDKERNGFFRCSICRTYLSSRKLGMEIGKSVRFIKRHQTFSPNWIMAPSLPIHFIGQFCSRRWSMMQRRAEFQIDNLPNDPNNRKLPIGFNRIDYYNLDGLYK